MPAPVGFITSGLTTGTGNFTFTSASFTPPANTLLVVKVIAAGGATGFGAASGGGLTWTAGITTPNVDGCAVGIWTAPVGGTSPGPMSFSVPVLASGSASASCWGEVLAGGQVAASPATDAEHGTGAPSANSITTQVPGSLVSWVNADAAHVNPVTRSYVGLSAGEYGSGSPNTGAGIWATEEGAPSAEPQFTFYFAYQSAALAGAQPYGLTAPAGQTWQTAALEIQPLAGTPVPVAAYEAFQFVGNTALATPTFSPAPGELIVAKGITDNSTASLSTPTGGGLTWTQRVLGAAANNCWQSIWTAVVPATPPGPMAVSVAGAINNARSLVVERWVGYKLAASPATSNQTFGSNAAPVCSITTAKAGSVITWLLGDFNGIRAPRFYVTSSAVPNDDGYAVSASAVGAYSGYQAAPSAGANAFGLTAPSSGGVAFQGIGLELQAAPPAASGSFMPFL